MIGSSAAWRKWLRVWLPGLILLLVNLGVLSTYRFLLAGQSQLRAARVERLESDLAQRQERHRSLAEVIDKAEINRARLKEFHSGWIASEAERLTRVIAEVKSMARSSGVSTSGYRYPGEKIEEFGLVRRSIVFSAEGSYTGMRRFINALEGSQQFLVLEEISASEVGGEGDVLRFNFTVSTLFTTASGDARTEA